MASLTAVSSAPVGSPARNAALLERGDLTSVVKMRLTLGAWVACSHAAVLETTSVAALRWRMFEVAFSGVLIMLFRTPLCPSPTGSARTRNRPAHESHRWPFRSRAALWVRRGGWSTEPEVVPTRLPRAFLVALLHRYVGRVSPILPRGSTKEPPTLVRAVPPGGLFLCFDIEHGTDSADC
jgi:hypothetical protein